MRDAPRIERECRVFTRLLAGEAPTPYVLSKYVEAHAVLGGCAPSAAIDRWLTAAARQGVLFARLADAYARLFAPNSAFRGKLVLLLAILETSPPFHGRIDRTEARGPLLAIGRLALVGSVGVLATLGGLVLFGPVHLWARVAGNHA